MFLQKKQVFNFFAGFLMQRSLEVNPKCMLSAPSNPTDKMEGGLLVIFLGFGLSIPPTPWKFFCRRPCPYM